MPSLVATTRTCIRKAPATRKRGRARPQTISQSSGSTNQLVGGDPDCFYDILNALQAGRCRHLLIGNEQAKNQSGRKRSWRRWLPCVQWLQCVAQFLVFTDRDGVLLASGPVGKLDLAVFVLALKPTSLGGPWSMWAAVVRACCRWYWSRHLGELARCSLVDRRDAWFAIRANKDSDGCLPKGIITAVCSEKNAEGSGCVKSMRIPMGP